MEIQELERRLGGSLSQEERRDRLLCIAFIVYCEKQQDLSPTDTFDLSRLLEVIYEEHLRSLIQDAYMYTRNVNDPAMRRSLVDIYHLFHSYHENELLSCYWELYDQLVLGEKDYRLITEPNLCQLVSDTESFHEDEKVLDVNIGQGRFLITLHEHHPDLQFFGYDLNNDDLLVARMSFYLEDMDVVILGSDFLKDPSTETYDFIFVNYPWQMNSSQPVLGHRYLQSKTPGYGAMIKAINSLSEQGVAICVSDDSFGSKAETLNLRQEIVDQHLLSGIMAMPKGTWKWTSRGYQLLRFSRSDVIRVVDARKGKKTKHRQSVLDLDAIKVMMNDSLAVKNKTIQENDYSFDVLTYLYKARLHLIHPTKLKDLCMVIKPIDLLPGKEACFKLTATDFDQGMIYEDQLKKDYCLISYRYTVDECDVVLSVNSEEVKAACLHDDTHYYVADEKLFILKMTSAKLLPDYLAIFLNSSQGQIAVKMQGAYTKRKLEEVEISVPSLEHQQAVIDRYEKLMDKRLKTMQTLYDIDLQLSALGEK